MQQNDIYALALVKADEIESELKRLGRWDVVPLSAEKFEDMGAFGSNTMIFEQWLQFVLIGRLREIVHKKGTFPSESMLAPYAIRYFDGDPEATELHSILYDLDNVINGTTDDHEVEDSPPVATSNSVELGGSTIPDVLFTLANILPQVHDEELESQLQTFDTFLDILSSSVRADVSELIHQAAMRTSNPASKLRLERAADSVKKGERAAAAYDHNAAMKKYIEDQKKSFPS